jgi:uncharacterized LabA/DUF88 family protein
MHLLPVGSAGNGLRRGYSFLARLASVCMTRVISFIDGQNLFYAARQAFGYSSPNYDPKRLTELVAGSRGWTVAGVQFYTGMPDLHDNPFWHRFWTAKCAVMRDQGVATFTRPLRYRDETVELPGGGIVTTRIGREKGIDVRIALDIVRLARSGALDVALVFSQDQDLSEVANEVRAIAREQGRWIKMACAFPASPAYANRRGIDKTDWIRLDQATYDQAIDPRDYRPRRVPS